MTSRFKAILKLAKETITNKERLNVNSALIGVRGYDFIDNKLSEYGFNLGQKAGKNRYRLKRGNELIENAVLQGDYQGMQIVMVETPEPHRNKVPRDAWYSPAHIYDQWEREQD